MATDAEVRGYANMTQHIVIPQEKISELMAGQDAFDPENSEHTLKFAQPVYIVGGGESPALVQLDTSDLQIGAIELKDGVTDHRVAISPVVTGGTNAVAIQHVAKAASTPPAHVGNGEEVTLLVDTQGKQGIFGSIAIEGVVPDTGRVPVVIENAAAISVALESNSVKFDTPQDVNVVSGEDCNVTLVSESGVALLVSASGALVTTPRKPSKTFLNSETIMLGQTSTTLASEITFHAETTTVRISVNDSFNSVLVTYDGSVPRGSADPAGIHGELLFPGAVIEVPVAQATTIKLISQCAESSSVYITESSEVY